MAQVINMDLEDYSAWLQATTAGMIAAAPAGPGRQTVMRQMAGMQPVTEFRAVAAPAATPTATPMSEIRRGVERAKRQMRREAIERACRGNPTQRRLANEAAAAHRAAVATTPPNPYDAPAAERRRLDEMREANR